MAAWRCFEVWRGRRQLGLGFREGEGRQLNVEVARGGGLIGAAKGASACGPCGAGLRGRVGLELESGSVGEEDDPDR
jgi:hypothetical protein